MEFKILYSILYSILYTRINRLSSNIGEPLRIMSDIMSYLDIKKEKGILFAADFQAAFDSLDYGFLKEALRVFGFHESFIKWVTVQHYNIESCVLNNGFSPASLKLKEESGKEIL